MSTYMYASIKYWHIHYTESENTYKIVECTSSKIHQPLLSKVVAELHLHFWQTSFVQNVKSEKKITDHQN